MTDRPDEIPDREHQDGKAERTFVGPDYLAERYGCHPRTIIRHCEEGQIPSVRIGRKRLIPLDWLLGEEARQLGE